MTTVEQVSAVQARYTPMLMEKPHVMGVAQGTQVGGDTPCLVVMVDVLPPDHDIPAQLDGITVEIRELGVFTTF